MNQITLQVPEKIILNYSWLVESSYALQVSWLIMGVTTYLLYAHFDDLNLSEHITLLVLCGFTGPIVPYIIMTEWFQGETHDN